MTVSTDAGGLDLGAFLRPGDHIVWGQACGEPTTLVEALLAQAATIGHLCAFAATSFSGILDAKAAETLSLSSMGAIGALRTIAAVRSHSSGATSTAFHSPMPTLLPPAGAAHD